MSHSRFLEESSQLTYHINIINMFQKTHPAASHQSISLNSTRSFLYEQLVLRSLPWRLNIKTYPLGSNCCLKSQHPGVLHTFFSPELIMQCFSRSGEFAPGAGDGLCKMDICDTCRWNSRNHTWSNFRCKLEMSTNYPMSKCPNNIQQSGIFIHGCKRL